MKIAKDKTKTQAKKKHERHITDIEKAIAGIKKLQRGNQNRMRVFISDGTVVVRTAPQTTLNKISNAGSFVTPIRQHRSPSSTIEPASKLVHLRSLFAGMQQIIDASNIDTEKAISTLKREQTPSDKAFYAALAAKTLHLKGQ